MTAAPIDLPRRYFPGLDSLRALAALAVVVTHVSFWAGWYPKGYLGAATARLDIGVAFFFVLSGFLLGRPFLSAMQDGRPLPRIGRYAWKRALRIVPLAVLVTVLALVVLEENRGLGVGPWVRNLTLTELYHDGGLPAGLTHLWSLSTEVAFYAVLPLGMLAAALVARRRGWSPRWALAALGLLVVANVAWTMELAGRWAGANQWLPAYLSWFAVGMALAVVQLEHQRRPASFSTLRELAGLPGTCWTMAAALFAVVCTPVAGPTSLLPATGGESVTKNLLYAAIAGLVVLPSALGPDHGTAYSNLLAHPWLRHLGLISYSIFCIHLLVLHLSAHLLDAPVFTGNGWALLGLTVAITLVLSEIAYRVVERPAMRLKDVRAPWRRSKDAATTPKAASTSH